jgi:hypothetical protein
VFATKISSFPAANSNPCANATTDIERDGVPGMRWTTSPDVALDDAG